MVRPGDGAEAVSAAAAAVAATLVTERVVATCVRGRIEPLAVTVTRLRTAPNDCSSFDALRADVSPSVDVCPFPDATARRERVPRLPWLATADVLESSSPALTDDLVRLRAASLSRSVPGDADLVAPDRSFWLLESSSAGWALAIPAPNGVGGSASGATAARPVVAKAAPAIR
jgi:hypothetical protein